MIPTPTGHRVTTDQPKYPDFGDTDYLLADILLRMEVLTHHMQFYLVDMVGDIDKERLYLDMVAELGESRGRLKALGERFTTGRVLLPR